MAGDFGDDFGLGAGRGLGHNCGEVPQRVVLGVAVEFVHHETVVGVYK